MHRMGMMGIQQNHWGNSCRGPHWRFGSFSSWLCLSRWDGGRDDTRIHSWDKMVLRTRGHVQRRERQELAISDSPCCVGHILAAGGEELAHLTKEGIMMVMRTLKIN